MDDRTELTEAELTDLRHLALIAHGNGYDGRDIESTQARVIATVERIVAARVSALSRDLAAQNTRIAAVEALHPRITLPDHHKATNERRGEVVLDRCGTCRGGREDYPHMFAAYPCPTLRALYVSDPGQDKENR